MEFFQEEWDAIHSKKVKEPTTLPERTEKLADLSSIVVTWDFPWQTVPKGERVKSVDPHNTIFKIKTGRKFFYRLCL